MSETTNNAGGEHSGGDSTVRVQQLFVRHQGIVKAFILSLQPGFADAEDVLQETFLVVTRRAADFREGTNFVAWACSIARLKLFEARRNASAPGLSEETLAALAAGVWSQAAANRTTFLTETELARCGVAESGQRLAAWRVASLAWSGAELANELRRLLAADSAALIKFLKSL